MRLRINKPRETVKDGIAWLAFIAAVVGGMAATASWVGDLVAKVIHIGPWYLPWIVVVIFFLLVLHDLIEDGLPDRLRTIYFVVLWPSALLSIEGKSGSKLNDWIDRFNEWLDKYIAEWITSGDVTKKDAALTGIAAIFISFALYWGHQYARGVKRAKEDLATAGSTTTTTTSGRGRGRR